MLRLPNPGSDISSFIRIFQTLFEELGDRPTFGLDDISRVLVTRNLATSSGYMGPEALVRSTRADRSRDPLYNQSKMYSELYRTLAWIHPQTNERLLFSFTYLGIHLALARKDPTLLFKESVLCIAYPNEVVGVKNNQIIRPFACILKTIQALDGLLCRDEMILGPLSIENDRDPAAMAEIIRDIRQLRGDWRRLARALKAAAKQRRITRNTAHNYTRFPLAVLEWTGWTKKVRRTDIYHRPIVFHELTEHGVAVTNWIDRALDLRAADLAKLNGHTVAALGRFSFYKMLERANFDITPVKTILDADLATIRQLDLAKAGARDLLFSPFHELSPEFAHTYFPNIQQREKHLSEQQVLKIQASAKFTQKLSHLVTLQPKPLPTTTLTKQDSLVRTLTLAYESANRNIPAAAEKVAVEYETANMGVFYPLIAHLFKILGYPCEATRGGVNYARWDALILDEQESMPIEIKSPGEELCLSPKSIRQALENKVILLARKPVPTQSKTTSLVVGYSLPNDRSEVNALVADIYKTFGLVIGIIDLQSLLRLAMSYLFENKRPDSHELQRLHGIIQLSNA